MRRQRNQRWTSARLCLPCALRLFACHVTTATKVTLQLFFAHVKLLSTAQHSKVRIKPFRFRACITITHMSARTLTCMAPSTSPHAVCVSSLSPHKEYGMTSTPICHNWSHHAGGFIHLARSSDTPNLDLSTTSLTKGMQPRSSLRSDTSATPHHHHQGKEGRAQKPQDVAHERAPSHECKPLQMQPGARRSTRQQTDQPIMYRTHAHHAPARYTLRGPQTKTNMIHCDHSVLRAADAVRTHTITGRRPPKEKRSLIGSSLLV